jgi:hypothetical protein
LESATTHRRRIVGVEVAVRGQYVAAMPKAFTEWTVLPHGPIERLAENLWRVSGSVPMMTLRRTMTVARLSDGRLVVHSPLALDDAEMKELESWGAPAFILAPNGYHRLDLTTFKRRYPAASLLCPRGARARVEQAQAVDGTWDSFPADPSVRLQPLAGVGDVEGIMFVTSDDGVTAVLGDVVFNMDRKRDPLGFLFTTLLGSAPGPRISRLVKAAMIKDRPALRADLERLAETPNLVRLIVAHEKVASGPAAPAALRQAATYL